MRVVYLDEGGISKPSDPHIVVAGIMVDADRQWKRVEDYLRDMADDFCLPQDREGFIFHASELSWGDATFRAKYDERKRLFFMRSLCDVPRIFQLPVFMQFVRREKLRENYPEYSFDQQNTQGLLFSTAGCGTRVERHMREHLSDEVAVLVYEQNGKKSEMVRNYHNMFRTAGIREYVANTPGSQISEFTKIIDTAHFARKEDARLLQIADAAVHVFTRRLRHAKLDQRCYQSMLMQLASYPDIWKQDILDLPSVWSELVP